MANEMTLHKLRQMKMTAMADAWEVQLQDHSMHELTFEQRLTLLVDIEYTSRLNNRLKRLIQSAGFDQAYASISGLDYSPGRRLNRDFIEQLSSCEYINQRHNLIIMGPTGAGKSYLACALGMEACKRFYKVKYIRLPELAMDLSISRTEGTIRKVRKHYEKYDLLILDEWMLVPLHEDEAKDIFEIIYARHQKKSTIFSSQFSPAGWYSKIPQQTIADAILDRIVHSSHMIEIGNGKDSTSMREVYGLKNSKHI